MLADYVMYWDPKSNKLFFPSFESLPVGRTFSDFRIRKFKPFRHLEGRYPRFKAVDITHFGTWGLFGFNEDEFLRKYIRKGKSPYRNATITERFRKFIKKHPELKDATFADATDCDGNSRVPRTAVITA